MGAHPRQMKLGVMIRGAGNHVAGWRHPSVPLREAEKARHYANIARIAEAGKMDFVFLADGPAVVHQFDPMLLSRLAASYHLEPLTLMSALAPLTKHVGLVASATTTYNQPYHVARMFASLDHLSDGRAGWNLVTSADQNEAQNFGRESHLPPTQRYALATEFADIVKALWNSWEDDAFLYDREAGLYANPEKMHFLNYRSDNFSVRGPLNVARPPQGHPVVFVAGSSEAGKELGARTADAMFTAQTRFEDAKRYYDDVKRRLSRYGRAPEELIIAPGSTIVVGRTMAEAREKAAFLETCIDTDVAVHFLSNVAEMDLSTLPLDEPLPRELRNLPNRTARFFLILDIAEREGLTLRQTALRFADGFGHHLAVGTPQSIADELQYWFENGAADGFVLRAAYVPEGVQDFASLVVPELQERGLFRTEYEGTTLRENLGLIRPPHVRPSETARGSAAQRAGQA